MVSKKQRLELTWIGKDEELKLEPRILIEDPEKSYGDPSSENMLIHGDNLLALKALEQDFSGRIKCIYIDPPYNTGNAFEHYDDGIEHSLWLNLMKPRLEILQKLLAKDGVIFISIDDEEQAYLKVLCDEVFNRRNYCGLFIWEKKKKPSFLSNMGNITEYILIYSKNKFFAPPFIYGETTKNKKYPINNAGNGVKILTFKSGSVAFNIPDGVVEPKDMSSGNIITKLLDRLEVKDGFNLNDFRLEGEWRYSQSKLNEIIENQETIFISQDPFRPNHIRDGGKPKKMKNLLSIAHYNMATYEDSAAETIKLFGNDPFDYPKPEKLISTIISSVTSANDYILDSFLGSGTTCAVAHKMGRKYIGIEFGEHANTHCLPRLKKVVDGNDNLSLSKVLDWKGGGGFKFYNLAPSLLRKDSFGNFVIDEQYNANMLAAAVCKHEAFNYNPDETVYWKHGRSTETDYIFVTTGFVTMEQLESIHAQMLENESLLICVKSFAPGIENKFTNITVKKIPQMILGKCEFGQDNYDLNIINATEELADESEDEQNEQ